MISLSDKQMHTFLMTISYHRFDDVGIRRKCAHYYGYFLRFLSQNERRYKCHSDDVITVTMMTSSLLVTISVQCSFKLTMYCKQTHCSLISDINECKQRTDDCHADATCLNTIGSYTCTCHVGYHGNGTSCTDDDECTSGTYTCDDTTQSCRNVPGSYKCPCKAGYTRKGRACIGE